MKRALVSVSDKTGLVEFVQGLVDCGYEIISTGGTKKALEAAGIHPIGISDVTGFPEIMDGRVKTLWPCQACVLAHCRRGMCGLYIRGQRLRPRP